MNCPDLISVKPSPTNAPTAAIFNIEPGFPVKSDRNIINIGNA